MKFFFKIEAVSNERFTEGCTNCVIRTKCDIIVSENCPADELAMYGTDYDEYKSYIFTFFQEEGESK